MGLTKEERETIVNFNEADGTAELYTASPVIYRRMTKRGFKGIEIDKNSWRFEILKKEVRLPVKRKQ